MKTYMFFCRMRLCAYCEMIMHSFICLNNCKTILCIRVLYYSLHLCFWYILIQCAIVSKKNISCILVKTSWKMLNFEIEIKQFKTNRQTSIFILTLAVWIIPHVYACAEFLHRCLYACNAWSENSALCNTISASFNHSKFESIAFI